MIIQFTIRTFDPNKVLALRTKRLALKAALINELDTIVLTYMLK